MANSDGLTDLKERLEEPQSATSDGETTTNPNLKDQIEADKYLKKTAGTAPPLRAFLIRPPGSTGR